MNNIAKPATCKIRKVRRGSLREHTFGVETDIRPSHGQFLQLSIPGVEKIPISVSSFGDDWMDFTIRSVGKVTDEIFEKQPDDVLFLRGAYGKGWPVEWFQGKHMVAITDGTGLAPVKGVLNISWNQEDFVKSVHLISGFKNEGGIIFGNDLERWKEKFTTVYALDTDRKDGWETGFVTESVLGIPFKDFGEDYNVVMVGPLPMIKFTGLEILSQGVPEEEVWMSFERRISCAMGKCGHCRTDEVYVCLDGPVFSYTQAKYLVDREGGDEGMNHDIDMKKMRISCFRQSKVVGEFMLQMRVPGAMIEAGRLKLVQDLYKRFDNGTFHLGTRQTFDIPGVKYKNIGEINKYIRSHIHDVDVEMCGVDMDVTDRGYPTAGARNTMSYIGSAHCVKGNANTYELARKIERLVFPSHCHIKVTVVGCPNDCVKANFNDFGIMGINKQVYDIDRCIGCGSCVDACRHHATGVLSLDRNDEIDRDACCCVGCGECSLICPTGAWTRGDKKLYRVTLGGHTNKQSPRAGKLFLNWVTEGVILGMFANWQKFFAWALDYKSEYLHGDHLIDRVGYKEFIKHIPERVEFSPEAKMADDIFWAESEQRGNMHMMPLSEHRHVGPQGPAKKQV